MLREHTWNLKYTPEDGDFAKLLHIPALKDAKRYDRLTGYFNATALTLVARGLEGLVSNEGCMRLVVGCTLEQPEIDAIMRGEQVDDVVEKKLTNLPLAPSDQSSGDALELLAWMVAGDFLKVRIAVPCGEEGQPVPDRAIFHAKTGIIEDLRGDRIAWTGSLNETGAGLQNNWESVSVYTSWGPEPGRVDEEETGFTQIWSGLSRRLIVLDVPEAVRQELFRFVPSTDKPKRLKPQENHLRDKVWKFIQEAPAHSKGGQSIGEKTAAIKPWQHQVKAFDRLYQNWPPKLLIADEVGLGKTVQAGMFLRQVWLDGRAKRILILAPKAVLHQWQIELRNKFNLNWPIYSDNKLSWYPSPAFQGQYTREVSRDEWYREPFVIASSQLMRRSGRASDLIQNAEPWDLVVLDEAHHARRRAAGSNSGNRPPNALLKLMRKLKIRTQGLILLTATPMQVDPVEVWDLLDLLGLPQIWNPDYFFDFFNDISQSNLSKEKLERLVPLFQSAEQMYGKTSANDIASLADLSNFKPTELNKILRALHDDSSIPRRKLTSKEHQGAITILRARSPTHRLISRNTRELLRRYFKKGVTDLQIAERQVDDRFLKMTQEETRIYNAVEDYISTTYNKAGADERRAVGFIMTVYRRRLASSFTALSKTMRKRYNALSELTHFRQIERIGFAHTPVSKDTLYDELAEDTPDDELADEIPDSDEMDDLAKEALNVEENLEIKRLLSQIKNLPPDSKLNTLKNELNQLRNDGYQQVIIFTQYTDTMDFLHDSLCQEFSLKLMCYSGRGGEVTDSVEGRRKIGREDAKQRFKNGEADVLICTDAAAEGLNFQFCGAIINYDLPWNPMRVEQRIGRIDRLGQKYNTIRTVNLHYEGTIETDIYRALCERIGMFKTFVGRLQPILAKLPSVISKSVLESQCRDASDRAKIITKIKQETVTVDNASFDIDAITEDDLSKPKQPKSAITMNDLDRIITSDNLMPPEIDVQTSGMRQYNLLLPNKKKRIRVTTDPSVFEKHVDSMELWSPGNPVFTAPNCMYDVELDPSQETLKDILDSRQ